MRIRNLVTNEITASRLSVEHPTSSLGLPILLVGDVAYGTGDNLLKVLRLVEATEEERQALHRAGYEIEPELSTAEAAEKWREMQAEALIRWNEKHRHDLESSAALKDFERMLDSKGKIRPNWDADAI